MTNGVLASASYLDHCNYCLVTSDLHLGDGSRLEDFVFDDGFKAWLGGLNAKAPVAETALVLNGDVVDFALIETENDIPDGLPSFLLWNEATSVRKLKVSMAHHEAFFDGLRSFHHQGGTIVITVGNHDLDWVWPAVQELFRARLNAGGSDRIVFENVGLAFAGVWVEHGHRFTPENAPKDAENFVHLHDGEEYLERVWGTDFMLTFFNSFHRTHPYANNIKPQLQLVFQGLKKGWFSWKDFVRITAFLARKKVPLGMITSVALSDTAVETAHIADWFDDPEAQAIIRERYAALTDEERSEAAELLDTELLANLERGQRIKIDVEDMFASPDPDDSGTDASTSPPLGLFRDSREIRAARDRIFEGHEHVVFGHSHQILEGDTIADTGGKLLWNPGTWIAHLHLADETVNAVIKQSGVTRAVLQTDSFYTADPCAIRINRADPVPTLVRLVDDPLLKGYFRPMPTSS